MTNPPDQPASPDQPDRLGGGDLPPQDAHPARQRDNNHGLMEKLKKLFLQQKGHNLLLPLLAVVGAYIFFSLWANNLVPGAGDCKLNQSPHTNPIENLLYAPLTHHALSSQLSSDVRFITLSADIEPAAALANVCVGRRFLTDLIAHLEHGARVIAIDKDFDREACNSTSEDRAAQAAFIQELDHAASHMPIVLGQSTRQRRNATKEDDCLVLNQPLTEPPPAQRTNSEPGIYYGLTRLNSNTLRIPLQWYVFDNQQQAANPKDFAVKHPNGFALEAASSFDGLLLSRPDLQNILHDFEHPYGAFTEDLHPIPAMDVVCASDGVKNQTNWCANYSNKSWRPESVGNKLVVIGQLSEADKQDFPNGEVYGSWLQVNYISALLQEQYVRRVPLLVDYLMLLILVALPIYIDHFWSQHHWRRLTRMPRRDDFWYQLRPLVDFSIAVIILSIIGIFVLLSSHRFAPVAFLSISGVIAGIGARLFDLLLRTARNAAQRNLSE